MDKQKVKLEIPILTIVKVVAILVLVYLLFLIRDIIVTLIISFIIAASFEPVVDRIQKKLRLPRWVGVALIYLCILVLLYLFISTVVPVVRDQIASLIQNQSTYLDKINTLVSGLPASYQSSFRGIVDSVPGEIQNFQFGGVFKSVFGVLSGLAGLFVILVISFYILSLKNGMKKTLSAFVPERRREIFIRIFGKITQKISHWFAGQILLSFTIGLVTFIGLWIMRIPYPLILAIIAAFTELIPLVGPWIGAIPAVIVAFFISPLMAVIVAIFYLFVQQLEGHILVPQVMKKAVGLNPIVVIVVLLIGARL
jgi:predicted PurR-regulated permease PerM